MIVQRLHFLIIIILIFGCNKKPVTLFTSLPAGYSGIDFQNNISDNDSFNILDYVYYYNGGGVAIGDINNDGLPDIYFTSNRESNKLYLNKGNLRFEDITSKAGVQGKGNWKTGVTLADINGDGLLDIYVSEVGGYKSLTGRNELFINNGPSPSRDGEGRAVTFTERAHEYGLDVEGFNTQAAFFDFDNDGDLDMFLVNHSVHSTESYGSGSERNVYNQTSGDKLFRNDRNGATIKFTEVSAQAGIYSGALGYGLNVMTADLNNDGWADIYVSNDFHENDYYYINNTDGTFSEINQDAFGHESRFSMGSDIADLNNDGWDDIITLDMLPADEKILKSSAGDDPLDIYNYKMARGYHHQYSKNCLQLNTGGGRHFSDISLYAGIAATDWSWSPLAADFNNDGIKDIFITNGILKRPNDLDFLQFVSNKYVSKELQNNRLEDKLAISKMPGGRISNYIFQGTDSLKFIDRTYAWGFDQPSFSNGAAYADLDNDGDVDIVINNINEKASLYENKSNKISHSHYIKLSLKGNAPNTSAVGARVLIKCKGNLQSSYITATHGFESASLAPVHFGTGNNTLIDTIEITWPGKQTQIFTKVEADQVLSVIQKDALFNSSLLLPTAKNNERDRLFVDLSDSIRLDYKHVENNFTDFNTQAFIPHELSTQGPKIAVADVNLDGLDDFFICGAANHSGKLFIQTAGGKFVSTNKLLFAKDSLCEDVNAVFFDANGDRYPDLYVVSGGNQYNGEAPVLSDRLYINDGEGNFYKSGGLPLIYGNKSVAIAEDIDHDGDLDLFVGGRVVAGSYGTIPESYIFLNDGKGNFKIANESEAVGLRRIGMVTDAVWTDIDNDGWKDLVIVGEWMPITVYKNDQGVLRNKTAELHLQNTTGLWTTIKAADLDNDKYEELLVGNWGENSKLHATEAYPLKLYVGDFDDNGIQDQILAIEKEQQYYPFLGKEDLEKRLPSLIKKRFLSYTKMAGLTVAKIFGEKVNHMKILSAATLSSSLIKNNKGVFTLTKLPGSVQWSPVFAFCTGDFNGDNKTDFLSGGNFFGVLPYEGRYDAQALDVIINANDRFIGLTPLLSGLNVKGEIRDIKKIRTIRHSEIYIIAKNNGACAIAGLNKK